MTDELDPAMEFLGHAGVKGMKWGVRKEGSGTASLSGPGTAGGATASLSNPRAEKRAQYKADLKSGREATKKGAELTEAQAKALKTNGKRQILATLAIAGAADVGTRMLIGRAANKVLAADGEKTVYDSLKQIGNLSTYPLRQNAGGTWG